uniref:Lipocalin-like domain-containing protein n=1 Tax=Prevotella sp. GTC17262 TaxID=3236797 RepID=A0AB33JJD4_9BACT
MLAVCISIVCNAKNDVSDIYGQYSGKLEMTTTMTSQTVTYALEKGANAGTVKLTLKGYKIGGNPFGDIVLDNVPVKETADGYEFGKVEGVSVETSLKKGGQNLTANLTLSLEGAANGVKGKELSVGLKIRLIDDIHTKFTGKKVSTGISAIQGDTRKAYVYYDITGRRVAKPTKRGIYIVNGKKVLIP